MKYSLIDYNPETSIARIQVTGCSKITSCVVLEGVVQGSPEWEDYLNSVAESVLMNMDPQSPTYDPSLTS